MKRYYQIAVDGPAGAGKSTIAKELAKKLGFLYVDSGAFYRVITLYFLKHKLLNKSKQEIKNKLKLMQISIKEKKGGNKIFLNKQDVTNEIRKSKITRYVSDVSAINAVRKEVVKRLKNISSIGNVVMDGRDIGSNVFKNASLKIYLTASSHVRAKRRMKDLKIFKEKVVLKDLIWQINERDNLDSSRNISPLVKAQDAIVIDTTDLTVEGVLNRILCFLPFNVNPKLASSNFSKILTGVIR